MKKYLIILLIMALVLLGSLFLKKKTYCIDFEYSNVLDNYSFELTKSTVDFNEEKTCVYKEFYGFEEPKGKMIVDTSSIKGTYIEENAVFKELPVSYVTTTGDSLTNDEIIGTTNIMVRWNSDVKRINSGFENVDSVIIYKYDSDDDLENIKNFEPVDLTEYRNTKTPLTIGELSMVELYTIIDGVYTPVKVDYSWTDLTFPEHDGEYLITLRVNNTKGALHFKIGNGEYERTLEESLFNNFDQSGTIRISQDNYGYPYHIYLESNLEQLSLSKVNNHEFYFYDFDYITTDKESSETVYRVEFRNGNELHIDGEIYYISENPLTNKILPDIVKSEPTHLNELVSFYDIKVIHYPNSGYDLGDGKPLMEYLDISDMQKAELINRLLEMNIYDASLLELGAGGCAYSLELVASDQIYQINDCSGSLYISDGNDSKGYVRNTSIESMLLDLGIVNRLY